MSDEFICAPPRISTIFNTHHPDEHDGIEIDVDTIDCDDCKEHSIIGSCTVCYHPHTHDGESLCNGCHVDATMFEQCIHNKKYKERFCTWQISQEVIEKHMGCRNGFFSIAAYNHLTHNLKHKKLVLETKEDIDVWFQFLENYNIKIYNLNYIIFSRLVGVINNRETQNLYLQEYYDEKQFNYDGPLIKSALSREERHSLKL